MKPRFVYCYNNPDNSYIQVAPPPYSLLALDPWYKLDDDSISDWLRPEGLKSVLRSFDDKTTADQYTIIVFCSFSQFEGFQEVLMQFCRYIPLPTKSLLIASVLCTCVHIFYGNLFMMYN